jgi:hypothetical protein
MNNRLEKSASVATYGLDMLKTHCETLNGYKWVQASGKRYVIAKDDMGRHYLDFRFMKDA